MSIPCDSHDRRLIANVRPPDWQNPTPAPRYNLVVIGAGTAGLVAAAGAAGLGARVALIEKHLMGGDCLYPTQAEAIRKTGDACNRNRLTPLVTRIFGFWLAWQRGRKAQLDPGGAA